MRRLSFALLLVAAGCSKSPVQTSAAGTPNQVETPAAAAPSEAQIGIPFYPGAKEVGGSRSADLVDAQFVTTDSIDKVVSFYKGSILDAVATGDKNETMIEFKREGASFSIDLHRDQRQGVTQISINLRR